MSDLPLIELSSVDSTNNYAMRLIDADKAYPGTAIVALSQTGGKGQRGRTWIDEPGQSLLMSLITDPKRPVTDQFIFNSSVAVAIAMVLKQLHQYWQVAIKWPNDIIINDKKAGGILIENILRGSKWANAVVGLGLNIRQSSFPTDLPIATSLKIESGQEYEISVIRDLIRDAVMSVVWVPVNDMEQYNALLYKKGQIQTFSTDGNKWDAQIVQANPDGSLSLQLIDGTIASYYHGQITWEWPL